MNENSDDYFKYVGLVNLEFNKELSSSKLSEIKAILFSPNTIKHIEFKDNISIDDVAKIKYYLEESFGIKLVLDNLKKYDYKNFNKEIKNFFEYKEDNFDLRKKFYKNINKNGINEIIKDFERN